MKEIILLIEDNKEITQAVKEYLESKNRIVYIANDGNEGRNIFNNNIDRIDLVIVDIVMPGLSGLELCSSIRMKSDVPIIILSGKFSESDKVMGFKVGADDYLTKPFSLVELEARIDAQLRRYKRYMGKECNVSNYEYSRGLSVNPDSGEVRVNKSYVSLTAKEYDLLLLFCKNPSKIFTKKELYENVWGEKDICGNNTVNVHIKSLREKIKDDLKSPKYIKTVWGSGYIFIGELKE
ncbi:MAG: response regulator transcription factor [Clostridium sp.]|uniref:response regulator transcription factor n=1 Tax=Clostridium sp. TaxID=1506 RepID=UPI002FC78613